MKSFLLFSFVFQILSGSAVSAFQSAPAVSVRPTFHPQPQTSFRPEPTRKPLLATTVLVDSTVVEAPTMNNPWDRVCTSVQTTAGQLNALRQKIAKSGVATAISYSLVSNAFTSVAVSLAWYGFSLQSGLSPVSPGQWKPFLAWYGGFYAVNSLLKPIRFMVALAVVPHTEQVMASFQTRLNDNKKAAIACSTTLLLVTSATMMAAGIGAASLASGVPIFSAAIL